MSILIGVALALLTWLLGRLAGFDRDRAFYPTVLIAIASYDVLFAIIAGAPSAILIEASFAALMVIIATVGLRLSPWITAAGFMLHGLADLVHGAFSPDAGIPSWWPGFCSAYDLVVAALLALGLFRSTRARLATHAPRSPDPAAAP